MAQIAAESDAEDLEAAMIVKQWKEQDQEHSPKALTGNYTRDFPEDFARSWSRNTSSGEEALLPADMDRAVQAEQL